MSDEVLPSILGMCAPPGFDAFLSGVGMVVVLGILAVVGLVEYLCVRDAYRFGRKGTSWYLGVITPAIFSGVGWFVAGPIGTVIGAPMVVAFGLGRNKANQNEATLYRPL